MVLRFGTEEQEPCTHFKINNKINSAICFQSHSGVSKRGFNYIKRVQERMEKGKYNFLSYRLDAILH